MDAMSFLNAQGLTLLPLLLYTQIMDKNPQRWWDLPAAFFLLVAILTVATRLYATSWTSHLERIQYLTLLGVIAGLALGKSRFSPRVAKWIAAAYGLFAVPWQLASFINVSDPWNERVATLGSQLGTALWEFLHSEPVQDPILFLALMAVLFWVLSVSAGYFLTRYGHPWVPIIPAGIGLYVINHYDPLLSTWARYIGVYLFAALLYLGRITYLRYRAEWQRTGVFQAPETGSAFGRAALVAVMVLVIFAWNFPVFAQAFSPASQMWVKVSQPWTKVREQFSNAFTSLRSSVGVVTDFYGSTLPLGTGTLLGDGIVFTVHATSSPPPGTHYYWQARTYDVYQDGQWTSNLSGQEKLGSTQKDLPYPDWKAREDVGFTFTSNVTLLSTMYTPLMPLWVDRTGQAVVGVNPDGSVEVDRLEASPPLHAGDVYTVRAWIAMPSVSDLQASGTDYPAGVTQRYLQLPASLPERDKALAQQLTQGLTNPYDKAAMITNYLRTTIKYQATIPQPPSNQDPIDWFLFDERAGFCNYYASSEVVLLRSLGIPARMVVGFAQGTYDDTTQLYTVRNRDGHAWPEVYFVGYGWIPFEPTAAQPAYQLPAGTSSQDTTNPLDTTISRLDRMNQELSGINAGGQPSNLTTLPQSKLMRLSRWFLLIPAALLIAGLILGWRMARRRKIVPAIPVLIETTLVRRGISAPRWLRSWARRASLSPVERTFASVNRALWLLGNPAPPSLTPTERVRLLSGILPPAQTHAEALLAEYQRTLYSRLPGNLATAEQASRQITRQAYRAFLRRLLIRQPVELPSTRGFEKI
jgi:transglutaminase-like putative cysteine protease